jgi:hypothetical protein
MQYGNYNGKAPPEHQVTILDGIMRVVGADHVLTVTTQAPIAGNAPNQALNAEAADLARKADAVVLVVGISGRQEGEMRDRNSIELPVVQQSLIESAAAAAGNKPIEDIRADDELWRILRQLKRVLDLSKRGVDEVLEAVVCHDG